MDENSWRFAQIVMWFIGIQTGILSGIFIFLWNNLTKKIDKQGVEHDTKMTELAAKIDKQGVEHDTKMTELAAKIDKQGAELAAKIDKQGAELTAKIDRQSDDFETKLSSIFHSINDLDKRLYGIETVLHMKDCCVLKQDQNLKKVE